MRIHTVLSALGVGLFAVTVTACSSGSKTTSAATTTTAITSTSTTSAAITAATSTSAATTSAVTTASAVAAGTTSATSAGASAKDLNACTLLSAAKASTLVGTHFTSAKSSTIASGQDQCEYAGSNTLTVIVYQPTSGVSWNMLSTVLKGVGTTKNVTGVGDQAMIGAIELDAQAGAHLVAVQGAGGLLSGNYKGAVAVAKAVVAGLG